MIYLLSFIYFFLNFSNAETLKGMHDTIGGPQSDGHLFIKKEFHFNPQVLSSDFGFSTHPNDSYRSRNDLLKKFIEIGPMLKIITMSYHQCRPDIMEPCTFNTGVANVDFSEEEWKELLNKNSKLNKKWLKQIDELALFISKLQDKKIVLYLRPYHEPNIPNFWWTSVKKPENYINLWKMLHDYLTIKKKLSNIKWVWSLSYHPKYLANLKAFYPGDNYVDILGFDIYPPKKDVAPDFKNAFDLLSSISKDKPKALTEVSQLPPDKEFKERQWFYVVPWGKTMLLKENSHNAIGEFYK